MSDPLTILRALHPDLRWNRLNANTLVGYANNTERCIKIHRSARACFLDVSTYARVTHHEPYPDATLEALANEAVELRRSIGWPVGVAS